MENGANTFSKNWITCGKFVDERGTLKVVDDRALPFKIKRVFWITNVPVNATRGHHSHRDCEQLILCLAGSFLVRLDDNRFYMSPIMKALYAPPGVNIVLSGFTPDAVCLVLASDYYNRNEVVDDRG